VAMSAGSREVGNRTLFDLCCRILDLINFEIRVVTGIVETLLYTYWLRVAFVLYLPTVAARYACPRNMLCKTVNVPPLDREHIFLLLGNGDSAKAESELYLRSSTTNTIC
jgi:hypothetical protein